MQADAHCVRLCYNQFNDMAKGENIMTAEQVLKDLSCLKERMKDSLIEAAKNEEKYGKLFLHTGWLTGICMALMCI